MGVADRVLYRSLRRWSAHPQVVERAFRHGGLPMLVPGDPAHAREISSPEAFRATLRDNFNSTTSEDPDRPFRWLRALERYQQCLERTTSGAPRALLPLIMLDAMVPGQTLTVHIPGSRADTRGMLEVTPAPHHTPIPRLGITPTHTPVAGSEGVRTARGEARDVRAGPAQLSSRAREQRQHSGPLGSTVMRVVIPASCLLEGSQGQ